MTPTERISFIDEIKDAISIKRPASSDDVDVAEAVFVALQLATNTSIVANFVDQFAPKPSRNG